MAAKPAVIPKKRKFSSASFESIDELNELPTTPEKVATDRFPVRSESPESEISPERTTDGKSPHD